MSTSDSDHAVAPTAATPQSAAPNSDVLEAISGYVYGFLSHPSYVTQGSYDGTATAASPSPVRAVDMGSIALSATPN
jgi:hypothetical protein